VVLLGDALRQRPAYTWKAIGGGGHGLLALLAWSCSGDRQLSEEFVGEALIYATR
jgi:hypothetical protein